MGVSDEGVFGVQHQRVLEKCAGFWEAWQGCIDEKGYNECRQPHRREYYKCVQKARGGGGAGIGVFTGVVHEAVCKGRGEEIGACMYRCGMLEGVVCVLLGPDGVFDGAVCGSVSASVNTESEHLEGASWGPRRRPPPTRRGGRATGGAAASARTTGR